MTERLWTLKDSGDNPRVYRVHLVRADPLKANASRIVIADRPEAAAAYCRDAYEFDRVDAVEEEIDTAVSAVIRFDGHSALQVDDDARRDGESDD